MFKVENGTVPIHAWGNSQLFNGTTLEDCPKCFQMKTDSGLAK